MGQKKTASRLQPAFTKMKDITNCVREKLSSCNARIMRLKKEKAVKKIEYTQNGIGETQPSYELQQLDSKKYDHYFKNNTRFYNYQRTHRMSENSDPEQHYQISKEQCEQKGNSQKSNENTRRPANRPRNPYRLHPNVRRRPATNHLTFVKPSNQELHDKDVDRNNNEEDDSCVCKIQKMNEIQSEPGVFSDNEQTIFESEEEGEKEEEEDTLEYDHPKPVQPAYVQKPYQLMHPDWRWIPHVPLYGWTPYHEQNIRRLYDEMAAGRMTSMYYKNAAEYEECEHLYQSLRKHNHFLKKPTVSTLEEVFELIKKTIQHDDRFVKSKGNKCSQFGGEDNGYDADVEETVI